LRRANGHSTAADAPSASPARVPASWLRNDAPIRLRYVAGEEAGLRRLRCGSGFRYVDAANVAVTDPETLLRIRSLAIPPAYEQVWICATEDGHLQATGRDARGRKQYRYHPAWRAVRDATKFERMLEFGQALPRVRARVARDLEQSGLTRERVLASVVHLLEQTLVRVGNDEYARANESFGLTTLRDDHVQVKREQVRFIFRGKSGVPHDVTVDDRRLVRVVRRCLDIPGQELFRYLDESRVPRDVGSADVNAYIREVSGGDFTAKDFRTWSGSVLALEALSQRPYGSMTQARREVAAAVKEVASRLSNTAAVCRKSYIHPVVLETYLEQGPQALPAADAVPPVRGLSPGEARLLALLERLGAPAQQKRPRRRPAAPAQPAGKREARLRA
jgi:DNA topoisomerase-1